MAANVVIVGSAGQDGTLLARTLIARGNAVIGLRRGDLAIDEPTAVAAFVADTRPDAIYFLAAHHHSSEESIADEGELFHASTRVNFTAAVNFLAAIARYRPTARLFYAASSLIFGASNGALQDEQTPPRPDTAYGITKLAGVLACRRYRETYGLHASVGILYNHESPLRPARFLSRKIVLAAARVAREGHGELLLGNLDASVDWGYAPDYVDAMIRIVAVDMPDEFIVATGQTHSVREFAAIAFAAAGLDYRNHVRAAPELLGRRLPPRIGNPAKLMTATGWRPSIDFATMVRRMVEAELAVVAPPPAQRAQP